MVPGIWDKGYDPLPTWDWVWVTLGPPKGHARATQASPKGRFRELPLFATKVEKCRVG